MACLFFFWSGIGRFRKLGDGRGSFVLLFEKRKGREKVKMKEKNGRTGKRFLNIYNIRLDTMFLILESDASPVKGFRGNITGYLKLIISESFQLNIYFNFFTLQD